MGTRERYQNVSITELPWVSAPWTPMVSMERVMHKPPDRRPGATVIAIRTIDDRCSRMEAWMIQKLPERRRRSGSFGSQRPRRVRGSQATKEIRHFSRGHAPREKSLSRSGLRRSKLHIIRFGPADQSLFISLLLLFKIEASLQF